MPATATRSVNDLIIRASEPDIARLFENLERTQPNGWRRNVQAESRLQTMGIRGGRDYCFACSASERRPAASVWLLPRHSGELHVSNIIPAERRDLSDEEQHLILAEFESAIRDAVRDGLKVETELVRRRPRLESYLLPDTMRRLMAFSDAADKRALNLDDNRRWQEFVIRSHLEGAELDPLLLDQWLTEHEWPPAQRRQLLSLYEASRSMLTAYDEERLEQCLP